MQEEIAGVLAKTLKPDKDAIKQATAKLGQLRKQTGFYISLMAIADDQQQPIDIRLSALANLKVSVERRWSATLIRNKQHFIQEAQKERIRKFLLEAVARCNIPHRLLPVWRAIIKQIIQMDHATWLPINQVAQAFKSVNPALVLNFVLAMVDGLEIPLDQRARSLDRVIAELFPLLFEVLQTHKTPEIIFLLTKIVWKAFGMDLREQGMKESFRWIPLMLSIIADYNKELAEKHSEDIKKYTSEFYYFHSKKWAMRLLYKFVQRHANHKHRKQNPEYSLEFYTRFGTVLATTLLAQVPIPLGKKTKYFLFKALEALAETNPKLIDGDAVQLLYSKLPPFLMLTPEDQSLAKDDPMEMLKRESDPVQMYTNVKRAAMDLWICLNQIDCTSALTKEYAPGKYLYKSMEYLREKLHSTVLLEKEMAMYVLCQLSNILRKVDKIKAAIPILIEKYVIPEFANPEMFLRARAVEMFRTYGNITFPDPSVLKQAVQSVFKCLSQDPQRIVNIKAACAFNSILSHKQAIEMVRPHLQQVFGIYIQLLENNELEEIVESLQGIVTHFTDDIGPYAVRLIAHVTKIFEKYCHTEEEAHASKHNHHKHASYDEEGEIAALACLSTISKIVNAPLPKGAVHQIEQFVIPIVGYAFTEQGNPYFEESLSLLAAYLYKVDTVSERVWFFYPVIFYYLLGMDGKLQELQSLPIINPLQPKIFSNLGTAHLQSLQDVVPAIRLFIFKGRDIVTKTTDFFGQSLLALLFRLADTLYLANPDHFDDIECEHATITAMFTHLLECVFNNREIVGLVWNVIKINLKDRQNKNGFLTLINLQLIGMCLYNAPELTIELMEAEGLTSTILQLVEKYQRKYLDEWHKQRILLGISGLFRAHPKPPRVAQHLPKLFKLARDLVKDIWNMRKDEELGDLSQTETEEFSGSQPNEVWDELHMIHYDSSIGNMDEIAYLEASLQQMQQSEPTIFASMIGCFTSNELQQLQVYISEAKQEFNRQKLELEQLA